LIYLCGKPPNKSIVVVSYILSILVHHLNASAGNMKYLPERYTYSYIHLYWIWYDIICVAFLVLLQRCGCNQYINRHAGACTVNVIGFQHHFPNENPPNKCLSLTSFCVAIWLVLAMCVLNCVQYSTHTVIQSGNALILPDIVDLAVCLSTVLVFWFWGISYPVTHFWQLYGHWVCIMFDIQYLLFTVKSVVSSLSK
jgi:hypothetical protein